MKKFLLLLLMILTVSGCGGNEPSEKDKMIIGVITQLNATPEQAKKFAKGDALNFYDDFNSMQLALSSEKIKAVQTHGSVARYMAANNSDFVIKESQTVKLVDDFCCAMREQDVDLKNEFDAAIEAMKSDGTLDELIDEYITHPLEIPPSVEIAKIDGAATIKVGITGDLPPLDLILADGTPAGFNTAVLSEISKRVNKNIELVQINSGARAAALTSNQVDVIFWVVVPADDSQRPKNFDTPEGVAVTAPYYQDEVEYVTLKEFAEYF